MLPPGKYYPTGLPALDATLGGGIPSGALIEISGPTGSGKTALCLRLAAAVRQARPDAALVWIDGDHTFTPAWLQVYRIDPQACYEARPGTLEQALDWMEQIVRCPEVGLAALDGADGLPTAADLQPVDLGRREHIEALNNRLSAGVRRLTQPLCNAGAVAVITHGPEESGPGATYHHLSTGMERMSLKLLADIRLRLEQSEPVYLGGRLAGLQVVLTVLKNPINPFRTRLEFDIIHL